MKRRQRHPNSIPMTCPQCKFSLDLSPSEAEVGMLCPQCWGQNLRPKTKNRPEKALSTLRPSTVRALIGSVACFILGPICIAAAYPNLGTRGVVLWARVFAFGILMVVAAFAFLITGLAGLWRDLNND